MAGARMVKWRSKEVTRAVGQNVAKALGKFGLVAEGHSKRELRKGHGVLTGTLRRSIHTAQPGYDWANDTGAGEEGGRIVEAAIDGNRITLQLGSGIRYALPVHQGHHGFAGYHFLTTGVDKARPELPDILKEHALEH